MRYIEISYSVIHDKFVHPSGSQGGPDGIDNSSAGVDVGDNLLLAMGILRPFLQQQDLRLHGVVGSSVLQVRKRINTRNLCSGDIYDIHYYAINTLTGNP